MAGTDRARAADVRSQTRKRSRVCETRRINREIHRAFRSVFERARLCAFCYVCETDGERFNWLIAEMPTTENVEVSVRQVTSRHVSGVREILKPLLHREGSARNFTPLPTYAPEVLRDSLAAFTHAPTSGSSLVVARTASGTFASPRWVATTAGRSAQREHGTCQINVRVVGRRPSSDEHTRIWRR